MKITQPTYLLTEEVQSPNSQIRSIPWFIPVRPLDLLHGKFDFPIDPLYLEMVAKFYICKVGPILFYF